MSNIRMMPFRVTHETGVDNACTIVSVVIGSGVALLALLLGPLLVGEYIIALGVSESHAGMILSTEMAAFTLGSAVLFGILGKNWRGIVATALSLMVVGNALFLFVDSLSAFVLSRFIAGFGAGMVMTMTIQVVGLMRDPDRIYGLWTIGQLALGALGMNFYPTVVAYGGIEAVFLIWALLAAMLFITLQFYPTGRESASTSVKPNGLNRRFVLGLFCLIGLFVYYSGQTGVWVYLERIGASWNLEQHVVAQILFVSLIAGIAGSGLATLLGNHLGRTLPISVAMFISAISIVLLIQSAGAMRFTLAACLFNFAWYLFLPYVSAVMAAMDIDGKLLTGLAVTFPASLAAGPAIAALFIGHSGTLLSGMIFGLVTIPLGILFILPATRLKSI